MLYKKSRTVALYSLLLITTNLSALTEAATIVSRSNVDPEAAATADIASSFGSKHQAQQLILGSNTDVKAIKFWGHYRDNSIPTDAFRVRFYTADGLNDPAEAWFSEQSSLSISRIDTSLKYTTSTTPLVQSRVYEYRVNLPSAVSLTAGTEYYFEIVNDTTDASRWAWNKTTDSALANQRWNRGSDGSVWASATTSAYLAYVLYDTEIALYDPQPSVPVPVMPAWLFGLIVLVIGLFGVKALPRR